MPELRTEMIGQGREPHLRAAYREGRKHVDDQGRWFDAPVAIVQSTRVRAASGTRESPGDSATIKPSPTAKERNGTPRFWLAA